MPNINPTKEYSIREIVLLNVLGRTASTVTRKIMEDMAGPNALKTRIEGTPYARRYKILGESLINYLNVRV